MLLMGLVTLRGLEQTLFATGELQKGRRILTRTQPGLELPSELWQTQPAVFYYCIWNKPSQSWFYRKEGVWSRQVSIPALRTSLEEAESRLPRAVHRLPGTTQILTKRKWKRNMRILYTKVNVVFQIKPRSVEQSQGLLQAKVFCSSFTQGFFSH